MKQVWRPDFPYNDIPRLPPTAELESKVILKQCIASRVALAELKQAAELIPNQAMLIGTIPLMEAKASSEIENIVTTNDALFRHQSSEAQADPATKEALRYRHALLEGFSGLGSHPLNTRTAEEICSRIKGIEMRVRRIPGTTLTNESTGQVVYTPPAGEDAIRTLLANWEQYIHNDAAGDPLIRMAVAHYQFEAIHPFTDGNGRTGRLLNSLFMIQENLLTLPILYLSRYIIANKADYYRLLMSITREQAWEPWILYILIGIEETAKWTSAKIAAIRQLTTITADHVRKTMPKLYSHELVDLIFQQPYCRITHLIEANLAKRETASRYLQRLTNIGVLREERFGREKVFIHPKLMHLLTRDSNKIVPYP